VARPAPTFVLRLRPGPGIDAVRALRWLLKSALRQHGLKCIEAREEPPLPPDCATYSSRSGPRSKSVA
jgi:hypothetical protein